MSKKCLFSTLFFVALFPAFGQTSLQYCYERTELNYPQIRERELIERSKEFTLKNAQTAYYPQFGLSLKATYQTDVTTIQLPGVTPIPKDQYQAMIELNQSLWDGGVVRNQKREIIASSEIEQEKLKVELYALRERVNNLFFGILMLDRKLEINALFDEELRRNLKKVESYVEGGIANSADVDAVLVEILNNNQNRVALDASRIAYCKMLSAMVGDEIDSLVEPVEPGVEGITINRPELDLFNSQIALSEVQKRSISAKNMPRLDIFAQGAYGNPGLDMLKAGFTPYALGGVRLHWNFGGYYTKKRNVALLEAQQQRVELQKATFLYNTNLSITQASGDVKRIKSQMKDDDQIIKLRSNIKHSSQAKVEGGTMSVVDMLRDVIAENSAIATKSMHKIELLMTLYNIKNQYND